MKLFKSMWQILTTGRPRASYEFVGEPLDPKSLPERYRTRTVSDTPTSPTYPPLNQKYLKLHIQNATAKAQRGYR